MKDGRPLVMETDSDEVRALLQSAELDGPPDGAMGRVLKRAGVGMGIAAVVTTATSVGVASQGATAGVGAGTTAVAGSGAVATSTALASGAKVGSLVVGKWLAVAAFVGAGAAAAVHVSKPAQPAQPANESALTKPAREPVAHAPAAPVATSEAASTSEPSVNAAPVAGPSRAKASPIGTADISGEIAAIALARGALDKGNARAGLAALDRYQQDFPHGVLAPEATVLRIEALHMSGDRARAKALGEAFLRAHPKSPHAQRVRSLVLGD